MTLPTEQDINPHDDLDGRIAAKHFLGKSLEEAESLFAENATYYQEDLLWMGPTGFRFYVQAAVRFIQSDAARGEADFISGFSETLDLRANQELQQIQSIAQEMARICGYIVEQWSKFSVDPEIYGDIRARYEDLQQRFASMGR